jgi:hypothetical protein
MLDSEIISAAEQILRAAWKLDLRLTLDWVGPNTVASRIFRVRTHAGDHDIPRTLIIKAANRAFTGDSPEMVSTSGPRSHTCKSSIAAPHSPHSFTQAVPMRTSPL